jgi:glutamate formiminotransferase
MNRAGLLEAVPNFSEGRDQAVIAAILDAMAAAGAEILDWSADPDHHRSVVTLVGTPAVVEDAAVAGARVAAERIDLSRHDGVHPRIGSLDVLPLVPLAGLGMETARASARRIGRRLAAEVGLPVYFYGGASEPPGRTLAGLRSGGFERLRSGWPPGREPDLLPDRWRHPGAHPSAGATCVGARGLLLAWNVFVAGISEEEAQRVAQTVRETDGGFAGVRALALRLPSRGRLQISMNLEDMERTAPMTVFTRIESLVRQAGGRIEETEIIGMLPDALLWGAAAERLGLAPETAGRLLSERIVEVLTRHGDGSQDA